MPNAYEPFTVDELPDDVLKEIFMWGVFGHDKKQPAAEIQVIKFGGIATLGGGHYALHPITVGHVCSRWRQLSLSTPLLWSSIDVEARTSQDLEILKLWLERSGKAKLSLSFYFPYSEEILFPQPLQLAFQHHHRWRSVSFKRYGEMEPDKAHVKRLARQWRTAVFGNLEHFSTSDDSQLSWDPLPSVFSSPRLNSLALDQLPQGAVCAPPLHQLTSLTLYNAIMTVSDAVQVLSSCVALKNLSLGVNNKESADKDLSTCGPKVTLNHLTYLSIWGYHNLPSLIAHLDTPCLEDLEICAMTGNLAVVLESTIGMVQGLCYLRMFDLRPTGITDDAEEAFRRLLPMPSLNSLEHLFLSSPALIQITATSLISTPNILAKLMYLHVDSFSHSLVPKDLAARMRHARPKLQVEIH